MSRDNEIAGQFQQNEIATFAFEAAQKPFTESICMNPDAILALELQKQEVENQAPRVDDETERIARQYQEQEYFEQEQQDGNLAQQLVDNDVRNNRNGGSVDRLTTEGRGNFSRPPYRLDRSDTALAKQVYADEIANSAFVAAEKPFTESVLRNPDAVLALELQKLEVENPPDDAENNESNRLAMQLQEHANLEQELLDANMAQRLIDSENGENTPRHGGRGNEVVEQTEGTTPIIADGRNRIVNSLSIRHNRRQRVPRVRRDIPSESNASQIDNDIDPDDYETLWTIQEQNGDVHNQGLTKRQIDCIPHHKYKTKHGSTRSENDSCSICLSDYRNGDTVKTLTCCHSYHRKCIDPWLKKNAVCPVCRENIRIH